MFSRIWRGFRNDVTLYAELKGKSEFASESWIVLAVSILIGAVLADLLYSFRSVVLAVGVAGIQYAVVSILMYLIIVALAWVIGTKVAKGIGSLTEVRTALAYVHAIPLMLAPIPIIGALASLWIFVTASFAIGETLGIRKVVAFVTFLASYAAATAIYLGLAPAIVTASLRLSQIIVSH